MKTKNIFKTLILAAVLVSACGKNEIANDENTEKKGFALPVTVNVTREGDDATKATYNESTRKLSFSAGDKLFVSGKDNNTAGNFKGVLTWVSGGTFSGSINTQYEYTGTADALLTDAAYVSATLLPAGYESYAFLSIEDETDGSGWVDRDLSKAFALTKKAAVEQFSYEYTYTTSYSSGFALAPQTAILSFAISGLAANTGVAVLFKVAYDTEATPVNVTTDASGVATFAVAVDNGDNIDYYTLTVDGNAIALPDKEVEAGHIYNISRSVAAVTTLDNTTTAWTAGSYAVPSGGLTYSDAITVSGDVTLTLTDGQTLTLNKGISLASGATLTVEGNGTMNVNGTNENTTSTVAGSTGTLILTSGTLTATGGNGGSVVELEYDAHGGNGGVAINGSVIVSGGSLTARGGNGGSVDFQCSNCSGGNGGDAISGSVTVSGGSLTASGGNGGSVGDWGQNCSGGNGGDAISGTLTKNGGSTSVNDGSNGSIDGVCDNCTAGTRGKGHN